jgi:intracellular septation protein
MQMFFEFLPIVVFFIVYKVNGIYAATIAATLMSVFQVGFYWFKHKKIDSIQLGMLILIVALGSATIIFHNPIYIKWKPTVINWILALVFLITQFFGKKPLIQKMAGNKIELPPAIWRTLNLSWIGFFVIMGSANLYVAYHYNTNTWVDFKLFGVLGLTVLFIVLQSIFLAKHMK